MSVRVNERRNNLSPGRPVKLFLSFQCVSCKVQWRKLGFASVSLNKSIFQYGTFVGRPKYCGELNTKVGMFSKLFYTSCCLTLKYLFASPYLRWTKHCIFFFRVPISSLFVVFFNKKGDLSERIPFCLSSKKIRAT